MQKTIKRDLQSDVDKFLEEFKKNHKHTASELAEMAKAERITKLRDKPYSK